MPAQRTCVCGHTVAWSTMLMRWGHVDVGRQVNVPSHEPRPRWVPPPQEATA